MKITRSVIQILLGFSVLAVIAIIHASAPSPQMNNAASPSVGMGDLHHAEASSATQTTSVGMGDLHFAEGQPATRLTGEKDDGRPYAGMGDVHFSESQQSIPVTAPTQNSQPYTGMGDWKRFEEQQVSGPTSPAWVEPEPNRTQPGR